MPIEHVIALTKDITLTIVGTVGAYVALRGLNTWNRQLKGSAEYDLARRILKVAYRLRDSIKVVRHPVVWPEEMLSPSEEDANGMNPEQLKHHGLSRAYQARWQKVADVRTDLQAELLEAEVLWGDELRTRFEALFKLEHELFISVRTFLTLSDPNEWPERKTAAQKHQSNFRDIMYDSLEDGGDEFMNDIVQAIAPIEEYVKPHLRR
jgi:hypothetical protein